MRFKVNSKLLSYVLMAALVFVLAGCSNSGDGQDGGEGETAGGRNSLVVTVTSEILTLDPQLSGGAAAETMTYQIFERLVYADEFNNVHPQLATSWDQSEDGLEWTFYLRNDVTFHDGEKFTAEDVYNTLNRYKTNEATRSYLYSNIAEVEVVDDYTVKIITEVPQANLLNALAYAGGAMMSSKSLERSDEEIGTSPVGCAPYQVKEVSGTEYVVLEQFTGYYGALPDAEEIKFLYVSEVSTRVNMLLAGEADFIFGLTAQDLESFEGNSDFIIQYADSNRVAHIGINTTKPYFEDQLVRQAMNYAVDKEALTAGVMSGLGTVAQSIVAETTWGYSNIGNYEYDPEKARQLLAEAGYEDGFSATLITPDGRYFKDKETCMAVASQLAEVGIDVKVEVLDWATILERVKVGNDEGNDVELYFFGWESSTGEAVYLINTLFTRANWAPTGWNTMFYVNEDVGALNEKAYACLDDDERLEYLANIQEIIMDDAPWVPLYVYQQAAVYRSDLGGITLLPIESPKFTEVTIK